ncbi:DUF2971 domain-containing protein [Gemmatimonas sp.]|uniref:DUF2971 domain-containing protein n=1 Tax=Gemmatimonas sp. TaxID=1962908 RepID=UPI003F6FCAB8
MAASPDIPNNAIAAAAEELASSNQRELLPLLIEGIKEPDFLFHYTSPGGMLGILKSRTIWATDVRFLNDSKEAAYAKELVKERLDSRSSSLPRDLERKWLRALRVADQTRAYVACFSTRGDSLSQWRAYGRAGYALGLSTEHLIKVARAQATRTLLLPCRYNRREQIELVDQVIDRLAQRHKDAVVGGIEPVSSLHAFEVSLYAAVVLFSASFKHPSFRDEHEWRLAQIPQVPAMQHDDVCVRDTGRSLVPYRSLPLQLPEQPLRLRQIVTGPSAQLELARTAAEALVDFCSVSCEEFRMTEIPYRDW